MAPELTVAEGHEIAREVNLNSCISLATWAWRWFTLILSKRQERDTTVSPHTVMMGCPYILTSSDAENLCKPIKRGEEARPKNFY